MANFAKAQLLKYGWTEGKGLGKNENGIVDALKPKLKFDTTGIGHDTKEYKWWESVYDKASSNIKIEKAEGSRDISVTAQDTDAVEITTRKLSLKKLRKSHNLQYGSFLKTCTLDNGKVVPEENLPKSSFNDIINEPAVLTDEQLFRACGGRTAHKGARHGLTLNGKLARIAQQEAELLGITEKDVEGNSEWTEVKRKKKSKRKRRRSMAEMDLDPTAINDTIQQTDANANCLVPEILLDQSRSPEIRKQSKSARRKEKRSFQALASQLDAFSLTDKTSEIDVFPDLEENTGSKKRKRKTNKESERAKLENGISSKKRKSVETNENEKPRELMLEKTIELADGNVITLDDDDYNDDGECTELPKKRKKDFSETDKLNNRIDKRKKQHRAIKEKRRVERLSECLMAVNLCEDSVDSGRGEDLVESFEVTRKLKKWKKHKKGKKEKKVEDIFILDPQI